MNPLLLLEFIKATRESIYFFWPEIILVVAIIMVLFMDLLIPVQHKKTVLSTVSVLFVLLSIGACINLFGVPPTLIFSGLLSVDPFAIYMKIFLGIATLLTILISWKNRELEPYPVGEYQILVLALYLSSMLLVGAVNLLMIMLALEMVSVSSYLLVAYRRELKQSIEAAMKYIVFGAAASGTMLYAVSWIYGLTGSLDLSGVASHLTSSAEHPRGWMVILLLLLAGIAYKISAVPFHFWAPDAYQGAATPVTAFLTVAPKAAGFAMFIRIFYHGFSTYQSEGFMGAGKWVPIPGVPWPMLVALIAAATMTWGNTVAIWQKNIKRMLAYSSIGHAGYMLMGALVLTNEGLNALLFYFFAYMLMNMGAFFVVIALSDVIPEYEDIDSFRGLAHQHPWLVLAMAVFLLSLAGIPPLIGFFGKFFLFAAAIDAGWSWLAVIAVINSAISLFYYVYVIKNMVMEAGEKKSIGVFTPLSYRICMSLAAAVFILGVLFSPVYRMAQRSSQITVDFQGSDIRAGDAVPSFHYSHETLAYTLSSAPFQVYSEIKTPDEKGWNACLCPLGHLSNSADSSGHSFLISPFENSLKVTRITTPAIHRITSPFTRKKRESCDKVRR